MSADAATMKTGTCVTAVDGFWMTIVITQPADGNVLTNKKNK